MKVNNGRMQFGHRNEAREKTITDEQLNRFLAAIPFIEEEKYVFFWENVYCCAAMLGLRSAETCRIRIEDIDFMDKTLTLPEQKNKERFEKIIIPDEMMRRIKDHIMKYKSEIVLNGSHGKDINQNDLRGEYYIFWRMREMKTGHKEKHLAEQTIRKHLEDTRKKAGLDHKYGMTKDGHTLAVLSYHTLRHYYLQKICDRRGVFAAQITGRHKNLRSTERYLTTSLVAKRDIVNEVFNTIPEQEVAQMKALKDEISELKALVKQSIIISNGSPDNVKNTSKIALEEAEKRMQNMALYESRQIRKGGPIQQESTVVVSSMER
ncbi:site-specific integrase [Candidatus Woesearchaeota archaeon]|nr:site-specific integrase [Candidatus Woesearchaeota archaeon]